MGARATVALLGVLVLPLVLGGCRESSGEQDAADHTRQSELESDAWLGHVGSATRDAAGPLPGETKAGDGQWLRPAVSWAAPPTGEPWRVAATELRSARAAGWEVAFVRCAPGEAIVDVVRELEDGSPATARIEAYAADLSGWGRGVTILGTARDHRDGDWVPMASTTAPASVDVSCLTGDVAETTWSGAPAFLPHVGGPVPQDA